MVVETQFAIFLGPQCDSFFTPEPGTPFVQKLKRNHEQALQVEITLIEAPIKLPEASLRQ